MNGQSTITIINSIKDAHGTITGWRNTVLTGVHIESKKSHALESSSQTSVMIWVRQTERSGLKCVPKRQLTQSNTFSLAVGDYIIIGVCRESPPVGKQSKSFFQKHDVLKITAVEDYRFGSASMQHWEVTIEP